MVSSFWRRKRELIGRYEFCWNWNELSGNTGIEFTEELLKEWIDKLFGKQDPTPTPQPKLEPELIQNGNVFEYTINRTGEKKQVIITDPKDSATMRKWWKGWVTVDTIYPNMRPKE